MRLAALVVALLAASPLAGALHSEPVPSDCEYVVVEVEGGVYLVVAQVEHAHRPECWPEEGVWVESNGTSSWQGSADHPDWDTHVGLP